MPEENGKDPRERDYSTEELQPIMVQHMADLNDLSKSLCSSSVVAEIEAIGVKINKEHFQDCPYYWRGADIQVIECSTDSSMQDWENSITQVGWGHEEPCPSRFPIFLAGLINSIQEKAYYLEFNNKFFWYESIAKTCQRVELQNQNLSKSDLGRAVIFGQITATNKMKRWLIEDQNLSEISNLYSEGWRLYFGYGRNANPKAMLGADRAPSARKIMVDYLDDHRFVIDSKGYASVVKAPGEKVWGLIWAVSPEDFAQLDLREGVAIGSYKKTTCQTALIQALAGHDRDTKATVYISNRPLGRNAQPGYIEGIIEGLSAEGARLYKKQGLEPTPLMLEVLEEYRRKSDPVAEFVRVCIVRKGGQSFHSVDDLVREVRQYLAQEDLPTPDESTIKKSLKRWLGDIKQHRTSNGRVRGYFGLAVEVPMDADVPF